MLPVSSVAGMILKISLLLCIIIAEANERDRYCKISKVHTMCLHPTTKPGKNCKEYMEKHLTQSEKNDILLLHNEARSKVAMGQEKRGLPGPQPKAANMMELTWDPELEKIAQRWADQCNNDDHDKCRDVDRFKVGQNMVAFGVSVAEFESDLKELVAKWYDEVADVPWTLIEKYSRRRRKRRAKIAHYTQMVWGATYKIGCGRSVYVAEMGSMLCMNEFLVCNYGPAGNVLGEAIYETGTPASKCGKGKPSKDFKGLCTLGEGNNGKQSLKSSRNKVTSRIWLNFTERRLESIRALLSHGTSVDGQSRSLIEHRLESGRTGENESELSLRKQSIEGTQEESYKSDDYEINEMEDKSEVKYYKIGKDTWFNDL